MHSVTPNHHAHHPGFSGASGLLAGFTFLVGRGDVAALAGRLTGTGPGDRVVDVGCGPGVAARHAAKLGAEVVGVDPADVMLRLGRLLRGGVRYERGSAEHLPVADDAATVLWALSTVHHWQDVEAGLAEARRVLAPAGRFLAVEKRTVAGARGHASHGWTDEQADLFAQRCRDAGFVDVRVAHHDAGRRPLLTVLADEPGAMAPDSSAGSDVTAW